MIQGCRPVFPATSKHLCFVFFFVRFHETCICEIVVSAELDTLVFLRFKGFVFCDSKWIFFSREFFLEGMESDRSRGRRYYANPFEGAMAGGRSRYRGVRARATQAPGPGAIARARASRRRRTYSSRLGVEKKFYDTMLVATALGAATDATGGEFDPSATSMISTPAVGDSEQNRDGKRIIIKSVQVKGIVTTDGINALTNLSSATPCEVFVALVLDTQSNGAQLNSEDVFKNLQAQASGNSRPLRNLLFGPRFRVLKEWQLTCRAGVAANNASATTISVNGDVQEFECFLPLSLLVNFNAGTTSSIANVIDNSLHIVAFSTNTAMTPKISYNARIRFIG